jgi:hypothetical protein
LGPNSSDSRMALSTSSRTPTLPEPTSDGVRFGRRDSGRAVYALALVGDLVESGRFSLPAARTFPLADVAEAHRVE